MRSPYEVRSQFDHNVQYYTENMLSCLMYEIVDGIIVLNDDNFKVSVQHNEAQLARVSKLNHLHALSPTAP